MLLHGSWQLSPDAGMLHEEEMRDKKLSTKTYLASEFFL